MIAPRPSQGISAGVLALMVHGLFFMALVFSVSWRALPQLPVYADLWSDLPDQPETPLPVQAEPALVEPLPPLREEPPIIPEPRVEPPPPAPPQVAPAPPPEPVAKPDIVLKSNPAAKEKAKEEAQRLAEQAKRREAARQQALLQQQEELKQAEELMRQEAAVQAAETRKQAVRLARRQLEEEMAQQQRVELAQEAARIRRAQDRIVLSARTRAILEYQERIRQKIQGYMRRCDQVPGNPEVVYKAQLLPTGEVLRLQLVKSSGNAICDEDVERAILKASPLPLPTDREAARAFLQDPLELKTMPNEDPAASTRG